MNIDNSPTIYLSDYDALWILYQIETSDYEYRAQVVRDALEHFRECPDTPVTDEMDDMEYVLAHVFNPPKDREPIEA